MNQKDFAKVALVIVFVVVLAGAVAYFGYFKKPGLQIYRNDTYGFEFKYPNKKLSAAEGYVSSIDPKKLVYVVNIFTIPHGQDRDGLVGVLNSSLNQTLLQSLNLSNSPKQTVSYNSISWTKISRNLSGSVYSDYLVERGGQTFWLGYSSNIKWVDFETILNTFKFVEPTTRINTSDWQTYHNEKYGLELKYPADWEVLEVSNELSLSLRNKKYGRSFEWPGLNLTDTDVVNEFAGAKNSKVFDISEVRNEVVRIYFIESGKKIYASCSLYNEPSVINDCNQILSTFKSTK